jgi:tRNA 2-selenouridine synthase
MFDSLLWFELEKLKGSPYILIEGESKKIGKLFIPEPFWKSMEKGKKIQLTIPLIERVEISMEDYGVNEFPSETYLEALERIRKILGDERYKKLKELIKAKSYKEAVKELMINYYDKLYSRSIPEVEETIEAKNIDDAVMKLKSVLNNLILSG